jgi:hypothetical protein
LIPSRYQLEITLPPYYQHILLVLGSSRNYSALENEYKTPKWVYFYDLMECPFIKIISLQSLTSLIERRGYAFFLRQSVIERAGCDNISLHASAFEPGLPDLFSSNFSVGPLSKSLFFGGPEVESNHQACHCDDCNDSVADGRRTSARHCVASTWGIMID